MQSTGIVQTHGILESPRAPRSKNLKQPCAAVFHTVQPSITNLVLADATRRVGDSQLRFC